MVNSRQKGKRFELEAVKMFKKHGFTARRGQQFKGGPGSPDIVVDELPYYHFEIKSGYKHATPGAWMAQAVADRDVTSQIPVVLYKASRRGWRVFLRCSWGLRTDLQLTDGGTTHVFAIQKSRVVTICDDLVEFDGEELVKALAAARL